MEIYIEYVIIDNLVINALILLCVKSTLKLRCKWYNILLSSLLGTIIAVISPLLKLSSPINILVKILLGTLMVALLGKYSSFKEYIFSFLLFVGYTVLLGGACFATLLVFNADLDLLAEGGYDIGLPLGVIFLIVSLYVSLIISIAKYVSRKRVLSPFLRKVVLCLSIYRLEFDAFIDSGNKLTDKKSGMPVVILSFDALSRHFSSDEMEKLMDDCGKGSEIFKGVHKTPYNTISGEAKDMVVFEADKLVIKNGESEYTTNRFIVGITYRKFKDASAYQMLLNPEVL